jgi:glycosyltransferase 2 family protein
MGESVMARHARTLRVLRALVLTATIGYIVYIFVHDLPAVLAQIAPFGWTRAGWLALATALAGLCTIGSAISFYFLARSHSSTTISCRQALRLHLMANLMRHVPGRFVGVAYQATAPLPGLTAADMVRVNVMQLLAGLGGNVLMGGGIVLICTGATWWGVLLATATLPAMLLLLTARLPAPLRRWAIERGPMRLRTLFSDAPASPPWLDLLLAVLVQMASWLPYLISWHLLGKVFPALANDSLVLLAASYSVAWAAGFIAFVTPGGLGVREAVFLLLGGLGATREPLVFLAVFARLWGLVADILAWLGAAAVLRTPGSEVAALSEHPNS